MILIAAADRNWAIGKDGDLLLRIPEDMKEFARKTTGNVIVVGRKTLESFPGGKPLPKRINVVLTGNPDYDGKGAVVVHSLGDMLRFLDSCADKEVFAAGGESIYRMLLPYCEKAYITRLEETFDADTWMPDLDSMPEWQVEDQTQEYSFGDDHRYRFVTYRNTHPVLKGDFHGGEKQ